MHHLAQRLEQWLATRQRDAEMALVEMGALPAAAWRELAGATCSACSRDAVRALSGRARELLGADPARAVALSRLATRLIDTMNGDPFDLEFAETAGDANRTHAAALFETGDYAGAEEVCDVAEVFYDIGGIALARHAAILGLIRGKIEFFLGRRREGLQRIEANANTLLSLCDDRKKYVEGRTIYAGLLFHDHRYQEAADILESSIEYAQEEGDTVLMAHIVDLIGACHYGLGQYEKAKECLDTALAIFTELELTTEALRVREGLVHLLVAQGRYNEAISEQFTIRSEYLRLEGPILAAMAAVDVVSYLFVAGRLHDVPSLCLEMIETFVSARLPDRAMKALAYLNERAQQRQATPDDVDEIRSFLRRLQNEPEAVFELS